MHNISLATYIIFASLLSVDLAAQENAGASSGEEEIIIVEEEVIIVEEPEEEIIIVDDASDKDTEEVIVIEQETTEEVIQIEDSSADAGSGEEIVLDAGDDAEQTVEFAQTSSTFQAGIDKAWLEYSALVEDNQSVDNLQYGHLSFSAKWTPDSTWEARIAARIDGYRQTGTPDWTDLDVDYGETYIRYRGDDMRVTVGAQQLIWGRIDEIPPTDRLSTVDARRFNLDDLQDRRLARPMIRIESFRGESKYDFVYMPTFREAELADMDSIWYPIDRARSKILGIEVNPALAALMPTSSIVNDAPDTDHAAALRFTSSASDVDYGVTVQHGRQTVPYFSYNAGTNTFEARYPRSWAVGGDFAFESEGVTWRFEGAWLSDVPVTNNLGYTEVEGLNWAAGMEFYPGDADTRVNLQLAGNHLLDADNVVERENVYNFNGSVNIPFAEERWRANVRFFFGLDEEDIYVNPEIAFVGWEPHELYLEAHYFDGDEGTLGGFHEDHSLISAGWRAKF